VIILPTITDLAGLVSLGDIQQAQARLSDLVYRTPLLPYHQISIDGVHVWLKPEQFQPIGSFKLRGAYNRLAALSAAERTHGVIAYSSGNHAQGVAYAARHLGMRALIVMPTNAPAVKIAATRSFGAEVVLYDPLIESREAVAAKLMAGEPWTLVPPFNDKYVIAGQGTIGLEIAHDLPAVDLVLTPIGGGGLLSGTATAIKGLQPTARIIGVEPEVAADAQASFRSGHIVELSSTEANRTIADGVRTLAVGALTFAQMRGYADDIVTVSEAEIKQAWYRLLTEAHVLVEPTSALPLAAYLYHRAELPAAKQVVLVLSGGNIDPAQISELLSVQPGGV